MRRVTRLQTPAPTLSAFDFTLPDSLIAQRPAPTRSASRLLVVREGDSPATPRLADRRFDELPALLAPGDLLVMNDSRVIAARLLGAKDSGGRVEVLVERLLDQHTARVQMRASKPARPGARIRFASAEAVVIARTEPFWDLRFTEPVGEVLAREGRLPLPPYIRHQPGRDDAERYQTVYAREPGSVAAPTAGLHFDEPLLARLAAAGVGTAFVTLHVGAGTFQPVRDDDPSRHRMHAERYRVAPQTAAAIAAARRAGARVVAVGTTALRALESACAAGTLEAPGWHETEIFITPGYRFCCVDRLITNFHLPRSTLLMLVAAFAGLDTIGAAYQHAIAHAYRFFSYGDAMFLDLAPPGR